MPEQVLEDQSNKSIIEKVRNKLLKPKIPESGYGRTVQSMLYGKQNLEIKYFEARSSTPACLADILNDHSKTPYGTSRLFTGVILPNHIILFSNEFPGHMYFVRDYNKKHGKDLKPLFYFDDTAEFIFSHNDRELVIFGNITSTEKLVSELLYFLVNSWPDNIIDIKVTAVNNYDNYINNHKREKKIGVIFEGTMRDAKNTFVV